MELRSLAPRAVPAGDRLARYAAAFPTAELNSSFYRWPRSAAFNSWRDRLPDGFRLSVKAPRGLTHARKLYAPEGWLQRIAAGWPFSYFSSGRVARGIALPGHPTSGPLI